MSVRMRYFWFDFFFFILVPVILVVVAFHIYSWRLYLDARRESDKAEIAWLRKTACKVELSENGRTWHPANPAFPDHTARFWRISQ